jgi:uncharacterized protein (TIGR00730 family)
MKVETKNGTNKKKFCVVIFGSARIEPGDPNWYLIYDLAKGLAEEGIDLVTGGGPGLMDAASVGHHAGDVSRKALSIGLQIKLPKKQRDSDHLDIKKEFSRFSTRLDNFIEFANAVVVAPGGVGTLLELLYTWQLLQVHMIHDIPIILLGKMWQDLVHWIKKWPLKNNYLKQEDVDLLTVVDNYEEALDKIKKVYQSTCNNMKEAS